jgi:hypothetical protein
MLIANMHAYSLLVNASLPGFEQGSKGSSCQEGLSFWSAAWDSGDLQVAMISLQATSVAVVHMPHVTVCNTSPVPTQRAEGSV